MLKWQTTPSPRNSFILKEKSPSNSLEIFHFSYELSDVEKLMQSPENYVSLEDIADDEDEEDIGDEIFTSSPNENQGTRETNHYFELDEKFNWLEDSFEHALSACTIVNCIHMTNGLTEVHHWIQNVTGSYIPKCNFVRLLKDGDILRQFITLIVGENCYAKLKRIRRSLPWRCLDNITYFLKECRKIGLRNEQLFTAADLHYIARTTENCFYDYEWNLRLRKVLMTFFWLAAHLGEQKKYEKHLRDVSIESLLSLTTNGQQTLLSKEDILGSGMAVAPVLSQNATLFKNPKRVTFHDHVMQHCCSVENLGKPFFLVDKKESPPEYGEFIKMKEDSISSAEQVSTTSSEKTSYVAFTPKSYLFADSDVLKDSNNNEKKHSPRSQRFKNFKLNSLSPNLKRFHSGKASKIRIPSSSSTVCDEGYATSSQNGGTPNLVSPEVLFTPTIQTVMESKQESLERSKYHTLPARYDGESYKKQFDFGEFSLRKNTPQLDIMETSDHHSQVESTVANKTSSDFVSLKNCNTLQRSSGYSRKQNTLTRREIKDLNALLGVFGDSIESGPISIDDDEEKKQTQRGNNVIETKREQMDVLDTNFKENHPSGTNTTDQNKLSYDLENVVNELLSLGDNNSSDILLNEQNLSHSISKNDKKTIYDETEPDFDAIEQALALNQIFTDSSNEDITNEGGLDDELNPNFGVEHSSEEGDDSGIDETMPGLMREEKSRNSNEKKSKQKRNDEPKKHKHGADKKERKNKDDKRRSGSGERKSKKSERNGSGDRSNSVSRNDRHKSGHSHHESNTGQHERTGRSKERRSEPNATSKVKLEKRRSEPVVSNKVRYENDIEGGAVGEYRCRNTDGTNYRKKEHKKDAKNSSKKHEPRVVIPTTTILPKQQPTEINLKPDKNALLKRNNSVHLNASSNEYMWDTADGKHRVYMRSGNKLEDPGPLPKKEMLNLDGNFRGVNTDRELIEELGVTPEMIRLLQEEEKFWQKQQELRQWRESRDTKMHSHNRAMDVSKHYNDSTYSTNHHRRSRSPDEKKTHEDHDWNPHLYERNYSNASRYSGYQSEQRVHREAPRYNRNVEDLQREADEERMAREAERLMRVRAEQEHVLKTSRENLLRDDDRPKFFEVSDNYNRHGMIRGHQQNSSSDRDHRRESQRANKTNVRDPDVIEKNYKTDRVSNENEADFPPFRLSDRNSRQNSRHGDNFKPSNRIQPTNDTGRTYSLSSKPPVPYTRTSSSGRTHNGRPYVCFSDDDEVFQESRHQHDMTSNGVDDFRGYFSDDGIRDVGIDKTYLARPLIRDRKSQLRCTECYKIISDDRIMHVEGQNIYWHSKCFMCTVCRAYLNDKHAIRVRIVHYKLHCRFCYSAQNGEQLSEV